MFRRNGGRTREAEAVFEVEGIQAFANQRVDFANPVELERSILEKGRIHAESLIVLEGRPAARESDMDSVEGAWDFEVIHKRYRCFEEVLRGGASRRCFEEVPKLQRRNESAAVELRDWWCREREAWIDAVSIDPLLPRALWSEGY